MDMSMDMPPSPSPSPSPSTMTTMSMNTMSMTLFTSHTTPLFTPAFTPQTKGQYAGACLFLITLSFILRLLLALKSRLETHWHANDLKRRYVVTARPRGRSSASKAAREKEQQQQREEEDDDSGSEFDVPNVTTPKSKNADGVLTVNGVTERVRVVQSAAAAAAAAAHATQPFRLSVDVVRAVYVTVLVGVAYLLMLAVMTMNVGYFLSVLGGAFLGELFFGRWTNTHVEEHH